MQSWQSGLMHSPAALEIWQQNVVVRRITAHPSLSAPTQYLILAKGVKGRSACALIIQVLASTFLTLKMSLTGQLDWICSMFHVSLPMDRYPAVSKDEYLATAAHKDPRLHRLPCYARRLMRCFPAKTQAISNTSCFHFGELLDHPNISALEESPDTKAHVSEALLKGSASPRPDHACLPDHARLKSTSCGLLLFPLYGKSPCRRSHCNDVNQ